MKITKFISLYPYWQIPATVSKNREVILPQFRVIKQDLWPFLRICVFRIWIPLIIYNENPRKHMIWRILYPEYNTLWRLDSMPSSTWTMYRIQILDIELALYFFLFFFFQIQLEISLGIIHLAEFEIIDVGRIVEGFIWIEMSFLLNDKNHLFEIPFQHRKYHFVEIYFSREIKLWH